MRTLTVFILTVLSCFVTGSAAYAQPSAGSFDSVLKVYAGAQRFSGSVLIYSKGEILFHGSYGWQDAATRIPHKDKDIYQIYSVTKSFTATLVLMLVKEGKLSLDDKLLTFYPEIPGSKDITIRDLLSHRSGLVDYTRITTKPITDKKEFIELMRTQQPEFKPGTDWAYSNSGYWFLGLIVEKVTGTSYEEAIARYIFRPAGMAHSGFHYKTLIDPDKSTGYRVYSPVQKTPAETYAPPGAYAAGDIWSNVEDLLRFHIALQDRRLLTDSLLSLAYTPLSHAYALGWMTDSIDGKQIVKHTGGAAGFRSSFVRVPADDLCMVVLGNTENEIQSLCDRLLKMVYHKPVQGFRHQPMAKPNLLPFEGFYLLNKEVLLQVYHEDSSLVVQPANQNRTILFTNGPNDFYVDELDGRIRFSKGPGGTMDTMTLSMNGRTIRGLRIRPAWGLVGSATPNGWEGPDIELRLNGDLWEISGVRLVKGEIKFRLRNDWTWNYGKGDGNDLVVNGKNIEVDEGVYDIFLDLRDALTPKFRIKKIGGQGLK